MIHLLTQNSLSDIDKHCLEEFRKHWSCLDNNNQQLWQCRRYERPLNKCVFDNLVRHSHPSKLHPAVTNRNCRAEVGEDHPRNPGKRDSSPRAQETNIRSPQDLDLRSSLSNPYDTTILNPLSNANTSCLPEAGTHPKPCLFISKLQDKCFEYMLLKLSHIADACWALVLTFAITKAYESCCTDSIDRDVIGGQDALVFGMK